MISTLNRYDPVHLVALAVLAVTLRFVTPATDEPGLSATKDGCGSVGVTDPSTIDLESFEALASCR